MPFTLAELVNISQILIDVLLGLIHTMFSDTRPNFVNAYRKAMLSVGARPLGEAQGLDLWNTTCQVTSEFRQYVYI